jgi:hypothetical protein
LQVDITRALQWIVTYTHNASAVNAPLPDTVRLAALLLAEQFAIAAAHPDVGLKSETLDDYSYTRAQSSGIDFDALQLGSLLDAYKVKQKNGNTELRLLVV